jgi:hypothetical protein
MTLFFTSVLILVGLLCYKVYHKTYLITARAILDALSPPQGGTSFVRVDILRHYLVRNYPDVKPASFLPILHRLRRKGQLTITPDNYVHLNLCAKPQP